MINTRSENLTLWIIAHRSILLLLIAAVSAFCLWQIRSIEFAGDLDSYIDGSHQEYESFRLAADRFGHYETYVVVIRAENVLDPGVVQIIESLSDSFEYDIDVSHVVSLTNLPLEFFDGEPRESIDAPGNREALLGNPYLGQDFLSSDGRQAQVLVLVDASEVSIEARLGLAKRLKTGAASFATEAVQINVTGPSVVAIEAMEVSRRDFRQVVWLVPLILGVVVLIVFQGHLIVLAPLFIVSIATLWTIGSFAAAGNKLSMMTTLMPVVISVIIFADVIHILHMYFCKSEMTRDRKSLVLQTMTPMNVACFMTSVTTAIGFIAMFAVSSISVVKLFTYWTAIGVMLSYLLTIVLMPVFLMLLPIPSVSARARYRSLPLNRLMTAFYQFSLRPGRGTLLVWLLLTSLFLWGSFQSSVQTDISRFLPADTPSIATLQLLRSGSDGVDSLDLVIDAQDGSFRQAERIVELKRLENDLAQAFSEIRSIQSLTGAIEGLYHNEGSSGFPIRTDDIEEYLLFIELTADEEWLRSFATEDFASVRVSLRIEHADSKATSILIEEIDQWLVTNSPAGWSIHSTGALKLLVINVQSLVDSQLKSFLLALSMITIVIFLFVRDWVLAAISLVVNIIPVLAALGFIAVLASVGLLPADYTTLNISTVMVPSLAMAIAVDDTIHYLYRYRMALHGTGSVSTAVKQALHGAGFAMTVTTVAMVLGFSVLFFSAIRANQEFAVMMCIALLAALLADLMLLPQLIQKWMVNRHVR